MHRRSKNDGTQDSETLPDRSPAAFLKVLSEERKGSSKTLARARYDPTTHKCHLFAPRGNITQTMGHSINNEVFLRPEETLFLLERGAMTVECSGVEMSIQQGYATFIGNGKEAEEGWLTLEQYQVYAYLKRLGYTVIRPFQKQLVKRKLPSPSQARPSFDTQPCSSPSGIVYNSFFLPTLGRLLHLTSWLLELVLRIPLRYGAEMLGWYRTNAGTKKENGKKEERIRPIVDGTETSYSEVFNKLKIVRRYDEVDSITDNASTEGKRSTYSISFYVYKPNPSFRKKKPRPPDYKIVVVSIEEASSPSYYELVKLLSEDNENIVFALVDEGDMSFLSFEDINFGNLPIEIVGIGEGKRRK
ncbi:9790_t:CDS:2 [Paraglomus brasilianum]|uniref:9790_t:CDS:1 n=1 Tax=Paraglomus brasilianum TaxID=144538 RepID=A0A9N9A9Q8_9GLOM|nr:9790_t:CDS:2 [Paraglomus brasilianum]